MDAQIDEGSVVPKYIKLSSPERKSMWTRMFRSGERIPKFIEMINLSLSLIVQLKRNLVYLPYQRLFWKHISCRP